MISWLMEHRSPSQIQIATENKTLSDKRHGVQSCINLQHVVQCRQKQPSKDSSDVQDNQTAAQMYMLAQLAEEREA